MIPTTSTTLLRQIGGDVRHARWAEFIARYTPMCRQYLRHQFPSLEADDILQGTFAALAKALPNYRYAPEEKGHFRNYLIGILRNKALMALRKQNRTNEMMAAYAEEKKHDTDKSSITVGDDWNKAIFEIALLQLMADTAIQERTKQIFVRTTIQQESPEKVAKTFGVSRNVVDQQKRRMLAKFKALVAALKDVL